jgi:hypothetical protein
MREEILHRGDQRDCLRLLLVSRVVSIVPSLSISISISISLLVLFCGVINSENNQQPCSHNCALRRARAFNRFIREYRVWTSIGGQPSAPTRWTQRSRSTS